MVLYQIIQKGGNVMANNKPPTKRSFSSRLKNLLFNNSLGGLLLALSIPLLVIVILVFAFTSYHIIAKILITILVYIGVISCISLCAIIISIFNNK